MNFKLYIITFFLSIFIVFNVVSQPVVSGSIKSKEKFKLKIISTSFDTFPNVNIVFKANDSVSKPIWGITKNQLSIEENNNECEIVDLKMLTNQINMRINILLDKSTSMLLNEYLIVDEYGRILYYDPDKYKAPIETAKEAIISFVKKFNDENVRIITFSDNVEVLNIENGNNELVGLISNIQAGGATSLYDAINSVSVNSGADTIVVNVLLTDGQDTKSIISYDELLGRIKNTSCINYIIGLGNVDSNKLTEIVHQTKGSYYSTSSAENLNEIYNDIYDNISSYYILTFSSRHISKDDSFVNYLINYVVDTQNCSDSVQNKLPLNVRNYVLSQYNQRLLVTSISVISVVGASVLLIRRRKRLNA